MDRILVPVDGTEQSDRALAFACSLAKPLGAKIFLLHVPLERAGIGELSDLAQRCGFFEDIESDLEEVQIVTPAAPMAGGTPVVVLPQGLVDRVGAHLVERAREAARECGVDDVSTLVEPGDAATVIVDQAKRQGVDLVVLGSRGVGDLKSVFLGSVSHKVAQECECPCTTVK